MCQSQADGGRRCAAHTRPAYHRTIGLLSSERDGTKRAALVDEHKTALIDHAMTPTGQSEFDNLIRTIETAYDTTPAATAAAETGRARYLAALRLTQIQAQVRAEVDVVARRAEAYARTGTHATPSVPVCEPDTVTSATPRPDSGGEAATPPARPESRRNDPVHLRLSTYTTTTAAGSSTVTTVTDINSPAAPVSCGHRRHSPSVSRTPVQGSTYLDCACDTSCTRCGAQPGAGCTTIDVTSQRGGFIGGGAPANTHAVRIKASPRIQGLKDGTRTRCDVGDHQWTPNATSTEATCSGCKRTEPIHSGGPQSSAAQRLFSGSAFRRQT